MDIKSVIYELRTKNGLSQDDLAHFISQVTPTLKQYMVATDEGQIFAVR